VSLGPRDPGRKGPLRRLWGAVRARLPFLGRNDPPEPPRSDEDPALVPTGPPRRPSPAAAAVLDLPAEPDPQVYPTETEVVGETVEDDDDQAPRQPV
jgi:hypothetical protein